MSCNNCRTYSTLYNYPCGNNCIKRCYSCLMEIQGICPKCKQVGVFGQNRTKALKEKMYHENHFAKNYLFEKVQPYLKNKDFLLFSQFIDNIFYDSRIFKEKDLCVFSEVYQQILEIIQVFIDNPVSYDFVSTKFYGMIISGEHTSWRDANAHNKILMNIIISFLCVRYVDIYTLFDNEHIDMPFPYDVFVSLFMFKLAKKQEEEEGEKEEEEEEEEEEEQEGEKEEEGDLFDQMSLKELCDLFSNWDKN